MGAPLQGAAKAFLCIFIGGWLIGWPWAAWDAGRAILFEPALLAHGACFAPAR